MFHLLAVCLLAAPVPQQPDVAIILWDDVANADIDEIATPNFDTLAANGVRFTRAYAHAWCAPTRDAFMRSSWISAYRGGLCGDASASPVVPYKHPQSNIASAFLHRGYATALTGKWHLGLLWPEADPVLAPVPFGFERWLQGPSSGGGCFGAFVANDGLLIPGGNKNLQQRNWFLNSLDDARAAGRPFFGILSTTDAHEPWVVSTFDPDPPVVFPPPGDRERFESEVRGLDAVLGMVMDALGPNAWVFVVGDNGTPEDVAPDPNKAKLTTFERGVNVPLLALGPGLVPGVCDDLVSIVDIYATLGDALGWDTPDLDGQSLVPALCGQSLARTWVYVENPTRPEAAVIEKRWKLRVSPLGAEELYDLENDPLETNPLPASGPDYDRLKLILDDVQAP